MRSSSTLREVESSVVVTASTAPRRWFAVPGAFHCATRSVGAAQADPSSEPGAQWGTASIAVAQSAPRTGV